MMGGSCPCRYTSPLRICHAQRLSTDISRRLCLRRHLMSRFVWPKVGVIFGSDLLLQLHICLTAQALETVPVCDELMSGSATDRTTDCCWRASDLCVSNLSIFPLVQLHGMVNVALSIFIYFDAKSKRTVLLSVSSTLSA